MPRKYIVTAALLAALGIAVVIWQGSRRKTIAGAEHVTEGVAERVTKVLQNKFHCTLYYTPRQTGFNASEGFDMTPETRAGLKNQKFPRDFLLAVEKEGFGRLEKPYEGKQYIRYSSGAWGFADHPTDNKQRPLVAKSSCAVSRKQKLLARECRFKISAANAPPDFERLSWTVADTGSGLAEEQIDLYWGEDDPLGPRKKLTRPKSGLVDLAETRVSVLK